MTARDDINQFLTSRRARVSPEQAGLPGGGTNRRVPGLRREEVAVLANISIEYYIRIERGDATNVSDSVLDGLATALQLDDAERLHLLDLLEAANGPNRAAPARRPASTEVRPVIRRIVDSLVGTPAIVLDTRLDMLHANQLGRALYLPMFDHDPPNHARFNFLDDRAHDFWPDLDRARDSVVAILRASAGRNPHDRALSDLVGELSTRSDEFARRWARHDVQLHHSLTMRFHHPVVGDLTLAKEVVDVEGDAGQRISFYSPEPGSPSHEAIALLASWAATHDPTDDAAGDPLATRRPGR